MMISYRGDGNRNGRGNQIPRPNLRNNPVVPFQRADRIRSNCDLKDLQSWTPDFRGFQNISVYDPSDWDLILECLIHRNKMSDALTEIKKRQRAEDQLEAFEFIIPMFGKVGQQLEKNQEVQQSIVDQLASMKDFDRSVKRKRSDSDDSPSPATKKSSTLEEGEEPDTFADSKLDPDFMSELDKIACSLSSNTNAKNSSSVSDVEFKAVEKKILTKGKRDLSKLKALAKALDVEVPKFGPNIGMGNKKIVNLMEKCAMKIKDKAAKRK
mmetsp:Transcript_25717/g.32055  ORF Transcript_25717/g.32055 Transcript_25717/m.32055 type:complete len:268 (-) Transcript_25717:616-1419(-)